MNTITSPVAFSSAVATIGETATSLCGGEWWGGYSESLAPFASDGECGYLDVGHDSDCDATENGVERICYCERNKTYLNLQGPLLFTE